MNKRKIKRKIKSLCLRFFIATGALTFALSGKNKAKSIDISNEDKKAVEEIGLKQLTENNEVLISEKEIKKIEQYSKIYKITKPTYFINDSNEKRLLEIGTLVLVNDNKIKNMAEVLLINGKEIEEGKISREALIYIEDLNSENTKKQGPKQIEKQNKNTKTEIQEKNDNEKIVGIDVSSIDSNDLEAVLLNKNFISKTTSRKIGDEYEDMNTSNLAGNVNFVFIKLGASAYGEEFSNWESEGYKERAKICKKLDIPFGFYYYSTAINKEEAIKEVELIKKLINECEDKPSLPVAIDIELTSGEIDRQYGKDVTEAKALIYKELKKAGINPILYISERVASENSGEQIINLSNFSKIVGADKNNKVQVWVSQYVLSNGELSESSKNYLNELQFYEKSNIEIVMHQDVLDAKIESTKVDINTVVKKAFDKWIKMKQNINLNNNNSIIDINNINKKTVTYSER